MELLKKDGYQYIDGGVCAAKGFRAGGINCGYNPNKEKNDLGMYVSDVVCEAAAVYTTNLVKGAPITVTRENLAKTGGKAQAVIANSKNANTCNRDGVERAREMCDIAGKALGLDPSLVVVASTGVIGQPFSCDPVRNNIDRLMADLSYDGNARAEWAIMTTDTVPKEVAVEFMIGGKKCHLGGMAKGSGMIHPNMATTLNFITSDAAVSAEMIQKALSDVVERTYNCLSVDADTSTNDMVCVMCNGLAGNEKIEAEGADYDAFRDALFLVMRGLTVMLAADGEGAGKLMICSVEGAPDFETGRTCARSIISSNLFKCAIFGEDANWGRVLCAIGYSGAKVDVEKIDVSFRSKSGQIDVCKGGYGVPFSEELGEKVLAEEEIEILVHLNQGEATAEAFGCDMTYDYVKINGDYRS